MDSAEKKIGIYSSAAGTKILVDGESRHKCGPTAPLSWSLAFVDAQQMPETYLITARKSGWTPAEHRLSMGESTVPPEIRFTLQPERKTIHITSDPPGASVFAEAEALKERTSCDVVRDFIRHETQELKSLKVEVQLDGYEAPEAP